MAEEIRAAVVEGRLPEIKKLINSNEFDIETPLLRGATLLWIAAEHGHLAIVKFLHEKSCSIDTPDDEQVTPLYIAAQNGHTEVVRYLINAGADLDRRKTSGATPLLISAQEGLLDIVRLLYEAGADVNLPMNNGITPFIAACFKGEASVASFLVLVGCDESCLAKEQPGIIWASQEGHIECIAAILEARINRERLRRTYHRLRQHREHRKSTHPVPVELNGAPLFESWLFKRGGALKLWKKRWFSLAPTRGHFLEYREQPDAPLISNIKPVDMVSIDQYPLEEKKEKPPVPGLSDFAFCITATEPKAKTYVLCATTEADRSRWISLLRSVSDAEKSKQRAHKPTLVLQISAR
eukprot:TRINITY_DN21409_c0_g1_i1.p1 TRINITY_DN21409_c0_g1~~TRINITY_DN21409_c0_g1_i1.p1  ORF type:complete len:353 (-),score=37.25 TRINITY_DN21409_c0_g1_i1:12-1070(-)